MSVFNKQRRDIKLEGFLRMDREVMDVSFDGDDELFLAKSFVFEEFITEEGEGRRLASFVAEGMTNEFGSC